jgi:DNA-binding transcriptional MocR family regulator
MIELGIGQPDPKLLPRAEMCQATGDLLRSASGWAPLAYGANAGPENLLQELARRIASCEREPDPTELIVTGGNSHALDELCTLLAQPGDAALVEATTYNFALQILRDHRLRVVPIAMDGNGLIPEAVTDAIRTLRGEGVRPAFLYTVPTFHNPTGISLALPRRHQLLTIAGENDLWVVEDDVYRDLFYSGSAPPSLWELDDARSVVRLGTFSKTLAPGLRVGWMTGPSQVITRLTEGGLRNSGGGISHFSAMAVGRFMAASQFESHLETLRVTYRSRRDALAAALEELLPGAEYDLPSGGYFVWLKPPGLVDTQELLPAAERAGVSFVPGHNFCSDGGGRNHMRLSFSMYSAEELRDGIGALSAALTSVGR